MSLSFVVGENMSDAEFVSDDDNTVDAGCWATEARLKGAKEGEDDTNADKDGEYPIIPSPAKVRADVAAGNVETAAEYMPRWCRKVTSVSIRGSSDSEAPVASPWTVRVAKWLE